MREIVSPLSGIRSPFGPVTSLLAIYALGGLKPFFVNDANGAKYLDDLTGNKNLHDVWDNASTGAATCIDADGSLKWGLHNLFVNSAVGVTQTISVTSGADFTIRFKGTGSITYSGAASGTLAGTGTDDIVRVEVTASTASLVCTVSGSITVVGVYRSDLGGMQLSSKDGQDYVETGASPKFALRVDHSNGVPEILAEPAGTNINRYLETKVTDWDNSSSTRTQLTGSYLGVFSGVRVASTGAVWNGTQTQQMSVTSGNKVSFTAVFVEGTSGKARISVRDATAATESIVKGSVGSLAAAALDFGTIADVKQWTVGSVNFVSFVLTPNSTTSTMSVRISPESNTVGEDIIAIAAQVEANHAPTSLIPTSGAAATRVKDEPSRGLPDDFIQGEGSIYFEGSLGYETGGSGFPRVFQIDDGTGDNRVGLIATESTNSIRVPVADGGVGVGAGSRVVNSGEVFKASARYADGDLALSVDGQDVQATSPASISTALTTVRIGDTTGVTDTVRIRDFRLFPYSSPAATPGWSDDTLETISGA